MRPPIHLFVCLSLPTLLACNTDKPDRPFEHVSQERSPIIGGTPDLFRSYVVGVGDTAFAFCTGTLISRRTVLTAAHCFGGIKRVYFGPSIATATHPAVIDVVKEVRHPSFDRSTLTHDLAILELAEDAPSQPVPLLRETMDESFVGPNFTFVGYGNDGQQNYEIRRVVTFPIGAVGPSNVGMDSGSGPIDETMFYYAIPKKNTCSGDSGGPAFVVRQQVERVAGATSYGDTDCTLDGVDSRTDAPAVAEFIQPMIDAFEGTDPCRADGVCDEACNVNHTLVDPDCAENHCEADGMCVLSCADPVDPDCPFVDHCAADGVCDPSCAAPDLDCGTRPPPDGGAGGGGMGGGTTGGEGGADGSSSSSSGAGGAPSSSSSGEGQGSGASGSGATTASGRTDVNEAEPSAPSETEEADGGCGCRAAGNETGTEGRLELGLSVGLLLVWRRRRARR